MEVPPRHGSVSSEGRAHQKGPRGGLMLAKKQSYVCVLILKSIHEGRVTVLVLHPLLVLEEELHCSLVASLCSPHERRHPSDVGAPLLVDVLPDPIRVPEVCRVDEARPAGDTALVLHQELHDLVPSVLSSNDEGCLAPLVPLALLIEVPGRHVYISEGRGAHEHRPAGGVLFIVHEEHCDIAVAGPGCVGKSRAASVVLQPLLVLDEGPDNLKTSLLCGNHQGGAALRVSRAVLVLSDRPSSLGVRAGHGDHQSGAASAVGQALFVRDQEGGDLCMALLRGDHQSCVAMRISKTMLKLDKCPNGLYT
eukprot:XP_001704557.1 Hypothetical protein GL50803_93024 [Giardia lamblia ATCC 50803]